MDADSFDLLVDPDSFLWFNPILLAFAGGLIFAVVNSWVAGTEGRNQYVWFFIGFVTGPIGLLFALLWPRNEKALIQEAVSRGELKKCPDCAELVKQEAVKCRYCGTDFNSS